MVLASCLVWAGCGDDPATDTDIDATPSVRVTSEAFDDGGEIPVRFTCDGDEVSPPLAWSGAPDGVRAWALVVDDPDAPGGTFVHWVVVDIPPDVHDLAEGEAPPGVEGATSGGDGGWTGPCPPSGTHHYRFTVYGLADPTGLDAGASMDDTTSAIEDAAVVEGTLVGTYARQ